MARALCRAVILLFVLGLGGAAHAERLAVNRDSAPGARVGAAAAKEATAAPVLRLKSGAFTLRRRTPPANALTPAQAAADPTAAAAPQEVYLQFTRQPTAAERADLKRRGVVLRGYVNGGVYLAKVPAGGVAALVALPNVQAVGGVAVADKVAPRLLARRLERHTVYPDGSLAFLVQFHADVDMYGAGTDALVAQGAVVLAYVALLHAAVVRAPDAALEAVAAESAVAWVEQLQPPMGAFNNDARAVLAVPSVNAAPHNLEGAGVDLLVFDAGIVDTTHPTFGGRATAGELGFVLDHATHVAGTAAGNGAGSPGAVFRGVANAANVISYEINANFAVPGWLYTDPGDIAANYQEAVGTHGADLATNSIGTNVALNGFDCAWEGDYQSTSQLIDAIANGSLGVRLPIFWAAGNERGGGRCGSAYGTIPPPAPTKNAIVVGAVNSDTLTMTAFSSWGPTDDGRIKPDVVGPGCQTAGDFGITSSIAGGTYAALCGTSMATPAVAGVGVLLAERYAALTGLPLEADLAKALLIHTAVDQGLPGPDYQFGYGAVHADRAVNFLNAGRYETGTVRNGEVIERLLTVDPGATSVRVTLAWADAPGAPMSAVNLVHDLDLEVVAPDATVMRPWTLNPADPAAPAVRTAPDALNNVEQVEVSTRFGDTVTPGQWTVRIRGANVASPTGQPFAICLSAPAAAAGPDALLSATAHDFGQVNLGGGDLWESLELLNQGSGSLTLTSVAFSTSAFQLVNPPPLPAVVPPDGLLRLTVGYRPPTGGVDGGTLTLGTNDPRQPFITVRLTGRTAPESVEDFEAGNGGYAPAGGWEFGVSPAPGAPLTTQLWGTGLLAPYLDNASWTLTSPVLDLTGLSAAQIAFDHFYRIESFFDGGNVKVSVNGGPFTVIQPQGGYPEAAIYDGSVPDLPANAGIPGEPGYSGASLGVETAAFDLTPFAGQQVRLRWHFGSDSSVADSGWFVDNVRLFTDRGPEVVWLTPPPSPMAGGTPVGMTWRTDRFGRDLSANALFFGRTTVLGQTPEQPGPPGTYSATLPAPNVGQTAAYKFAVRVRSGFVEIVSPILSATVEPGPAPPVVQWLSAPPASAVSGDSFTLRWRVSNFVGPLDKNAVAWGVTRVIAQSPDQLGGNGDYAATITVPTVTSAGNLLYVPFAANDIEFAFPTPITVRINP